MESVTLFVFGNKMINLDRDTLKKLLLKTFDEGCSGYQDLKDGFIEQILVEAEKLSQKDIKPTRSRKNRISNLTDWGSFAEETAKENMISWARNVSNSGWLTTKRNADI
jgi:hypothetical protein